MLSSVRTPSCSRRSKPGATSMRWSRWTRSSRPSTGPMAAKTAGQASPTSASGTACSCGSATASPRRVRVGLVTPMWSATRSVDQSAWTTAVPSTTSGRVPPAVSASRAPIASVADSSEITGSRPLETPDRSTRRCRAPWERGTSQHGVVAVGHQLGGHALQAVQRVGHHAPGPHHVEGVERGVERRGVRTHGAPARSAPGRDAESRRVLDDRCLEPVEQVGHRLILDGDPTDGHRAGDDDHLVGPVGLVVGLPQRVGSPPTAYVGVDHGDEVDRLARATAHLDEEVHVGRVQPAAGCLRVVRHERVDGGGRGPTGPRRRARCARSARRSRGAPVPGCGRAARRSGRGR